SQVFAWSRRLESIGRTAEFRLPVQFQINMNLFLDPSQVYQRPARLHVPGWALAMPQRELAQPLPCAVLILPGVLRLPAPNTQRLVVRVGHQQAQDRRLGSCAPG